MYSNYNVLTLPIETDGRFKIGDTFVLSRNQKKICNWRIMKFDGLEIKNIDYCFGVRLHFDFKEWRNKNENS